MIVAGRQLFSANQPICSANIFVIARISFAEVVAQDVGRLMPPLANEMPHENVTALRDADTEQIDKHNNVVAIGACRQSLVTDLVDVISDDYLR